MQNLMHGRIGDGDGNVMSTMNKDKKLKGLEEEPGVSIVWRCASRAVVKVEVEDLIVDLEMGTWETEAREVVRDKHSDVSIERHQQIAMPTESDRQDIVVAC